MRVKAAAAAAAGGLQRKTGARTAAAELLTTVNTRLGTYIVCPARIILLLLLYVRVTRSE